MATLNVEEAKTSEGTPVDDAVREMGSGEMAVDNGRPWSRWELGAYGVLLLVALVMRVWDLGDQAIHHDESLHAIYSWYLTEGRGYIHNPLMHGPFQFFGISALYRIFGDGDAVVRLLPALFGTALVGLPALLRGHLGRLGALMTALLLAFSPSMLYFSRFARNDIFMAVWTLALVALMWRYMDTRRSRYLVLAAMVLAFAFATKETVYIVVAILGSYLVLRAASDVFPWLIGRRRLWEFSPAGNFLVVLGTLTFPLLAAVISIIQGRLGLTLANGDPNVAAVGVPIGAGLYVAFVVSVVFLVVAAVVGLRWRRWLWLACFGAFVIVWVPLYTTFFTNALGIGSGIWQSLGYWLQQHEVCRGCQPWYYYFVIGLNYEFLVFVLAVPAMVYYVRRGDRFSRFLVYWAALNFILYTFAGEKMPWLLVQVSLPFILLAGKLLGDLVQRAILVSPRRETVGGDAEGQEWPSGLVERPRPTVHWMGITAAGVVAVLLAASGLALSRFLAPDFVVGNWLGLVLLVFVLAGTTAFILRLIQREKRLAVATVGLAAAMFALGVVGAFRLSYSNNDIPVEMLVYTQTTPDIPAILSDIERLGEVTGKGKELRITVDSTDGFSWPWAWYLRDYTRVSYPCLSNDSGCTALTEPPDADVVLLAARSQSTAAQSLREFGGAVRYKHRWWFPESYRGLDPGTIAGSIGEKESWRRVVDYFLFRDFPEERLGAVEAYAYFPKDFRPTDLTVRG